ncbi:MAG: PKD domain-containing protein [Actinobacteria bacterium]|nr:PKD domain-containing protein [Actinomycetota bacterium]
MPRVRAGGKANVAMGALLTRRGSFADPGADTWTGAVDWGDGSARTTLRLRADKTFALAHRFPRARGRRYTVVVTVRDDDGGSGSARFRVTVR